MYADFRENQVLELDRQETIKSFCGPNPVYGRQLIVLAALFDDDLASAFVKRVRAHFFKDAFLKEMAGYSCGSVGSYGVVDSQKISRLLLRNNSEFKINVTINQIERLAQIIQTDDVDEALGYLREIKPGVAA